MGVAAEGGEVSATAWQICPRCYATAVKAHEKELAEVAQSYGKINSAEWIERNAAAQQPTNLEETLREDYEMLIEKNGNFYISYQASCEICGFEHSFKHEEQLDLSE